MDFDHLDDRYLYHLAVDSLWQAAKPDGVYLPEQFAGEGFIHCSLAGQIMGVARRFYAGRSDMVLLRIDPARLNCEVRHENLEGGSTLFPHVYGPLPVAAVIEVIPFPSV